MGTKNKPIKKHSFEKNSDGNGGIFITGTGAVLKCKRIPALQIASLRESCAEQWRVTQGKEPPTPPTYTAANGVEYAHNSDSIKDNPEQQNDWNTYLKELKEYSDLESSQAFEVFLKLGVDVEKERDGWEKEAREIFTNIPRDGQRRKLFYIKNNLTSTEEGVALYAALQGLAGIHEDLLAKVDAMFQHPMGESNGADTSTGEGANPR